MAVALVGCGDSGLKEKVEEQSAMIADLKDDIKELKSAIDKLDTHITAPAGGGQALNPATGLPMGAAGGGMPVGVPGMPVPAAGGPGRLPGAGVGPGLPGRFPGAGGGLPGGGRGSTVDPSTGLPRPASQNPGPQTRPRR